MFNVIKIEGESWHNIHANAYLIGQGVEPGDQLSITVLTAVERFHFGDVMPSEDDVGYVRIKQDDIVVTQEGVDCWVLGPAELQVEYAP